MDALAPARDAFAGAARISRRHPDLLFAVGLTVAAALPRLWSLGDVPQGVHGDEAQFAMDAQRLLDSGWIGVYTPSALGQPAGIAYVSAIGQWLFGATALGARLGVTFVSIAAVPLAYLLFRLLADRTVAVIAALLLAVSLWHIHLGRVAAPTALVPTSELATLTLWTIGLRRGDWYWFLLAGVSLGLGLYTYTVYPSFVVAFALWILIYTVVWKRGPGFWPWAHNVAIAALAAFVTALPLFAYIADPDNDYFGHYRNYYDLYSVPASDAYAQADFGGRVDLIVDQAGRFLGAYAWHGTTDFVDGAAPDGLPMFGPLMLALLLAGTGLALWRWRETTYPLCLLMVVVLPLTTVLQTNATYRGPLGAVPFLLFLGALPLAFLWQRAAGFKTGLAIGARAAVVIVLLLVAYRDLNAYFGAWARSPGFDWVYARQISEASVYAQSLPGRPYVYFYSSRWSFDYETRQYLAPDLEGEDRSREFGRRQDYGIDSSRDALFLLLPSYFGDLALLRRYYSGGEAYVAQDGDEVLFIAYLVRAPPAP